MARPKKKGVDYFPHDCITGKTIFILEQKFGNDGYALWFKLLEYLGTKEGHFLDCSDLEDMEFLQAKTRLDGETICRILDLCANLNAIDRELWNRKIVWSQRFVDGISDVYVNRRVETPSKPSNYTVSTVLNPAKPAFSGTPTSKSTQSKVKESKVDKSKVKEKEPDGLERIDDILVESEIFKNINMSAKNGHEEIPLPFTDSEFTEKWKEWLQYRKERRLGAYAPTGLKSTFTRLKKMCHDDPRIAIEVIDQSLANNWQGLFELKQNFNGKVTQRIAEKPTATGNVAPGGFGQF